jgi:hypothetical protein
MMPNIRLHQESESLVTYAQKMRFPVMGRFNATAQGMIICEYQPQTRMLITDNKTIRVYLPYLLHVISYYKNKDGKYLYPGISAAGLRVYISQKSLQTLDDLVWISPTDIRFGGLSCTPHEYDFTTFSSLQNLTKGVSSLWFNSIHESIFMQNMLDNKNIQEALRCQSWHKNIRKYYFGNEIADPKYTNPHSLSNFLNCKRDCSYGYGDGTHFLEKAKLHTESQIINVDFSNVFKEI